MHRMTTTIEALLIALISASCASSAASNDALPDHGPITLSCSQITTGSLHLPGLRVVSAVEVAATASLPAHCQITGALNERTGIDSKPYAIGFELRTPLPDAWNGKFFFQGGGGTNGVIVPATGNLLNAPSGTALALGYAVTSTDGGHATGQSDATFGIDPQARSDYGYNAVVQVTAAAKWIVLAHYGRGPQRSYFLGCSNGGRDAMVAASRIPFEYDGFVAADPGFQLPKAAVAQQWDSQQFFAAASAPGQLPKDTFPATAMALVAQRVLAKCDVLDGVSDGMVHDRVACQRAFSLASDVPTCSGAPDATCLTAAQKTALGNVFTGARNSAGQRLYAGWPWDPGIAGAGWRFWKLDAGFAPLPFNTIIGAGSTGYVFTTPPDKPDLSDGGVAYQLGFRMDTDAPKIFATTSVYKESAMAFMAPPDLRFTTLPLRGKLIVVHGTADPVFSVDDTIAWYDALTANDPAAARYARLFLVPGMNHCAGGPATDRFDVLTPLVNWVEHSVAPDTIAAAVNPSDPDVVAARWPATRSRPLCAYPKQAVLKPGATDTEAAASFQCQ